jgi:pimeloyl-ACP methyl ester carboxylesterase
VVGEDDPGTPVAAARVIHEAVAGSRLAVLSNASHQAPVEQPQAFANTVLDFLKKPVGG